MTSTYSTRAASGPTKDGLRMTLPASTGARTSSTLATVMRNGELKIYYGVAFR